MDAKSRSFYSDLDEHLEKILQQGKKHRHASSAVQSEKDDEQKSKKKRTKRAIAISSIAGVLVVAILLGVLFGGGIFGDKSDPAKENASGVTVKELSDKKTGITVSGEGLPQNATLSVNTVASSNTTVSNALIGVSDKYVAYDISIAESFTGDVTVKVPLPDTLNEKLIAVYYIVDNGNRAEIESSISNGHVIFTTNHFSIYAIAEKYSDGFAYSKQSDGTYYVSQYSGSATTGGRPSNLSDGTKITGIDSSANLGNAKNVVIPKEIETVKSNAFGNSDKIEKIYYYGNSAEWEQINVESGNEALKSATKYYYSETKPSRQGNWWHTVDGAPTVWTDEVVDNSATITFFSKIGNGTFESVNTEVGAIYILPDVGFQRSGYEFIGWATSPSGYVEYQENASYYVTAESVQFYAVWKRLEGTIVFDANTGSGTMSSQTIPVGESATLNQITFSKSGYYFWGWSTVKGGSVVYTDMASYTMTDKKTVTLYAVWKTTAPNAVTLSFNANGGSGSMSSMSIEKGSTVTLPKNTFTKSGYTFAGWATSSSGSVVYNDQASYTMSSSYTVTLYAVWTPKTNTLIFKANGGSGSMTSMSLKTGESTYLPQNTFTRTNYIFKGWSTSASGSVVYKDQAYYTMGTSSTVTLYAVWQFDPNLVTISFYIDDEELIAPMIVEKGSTVTLPKCTHKKDGYKFMGWTHNGTTGVAFSDQATFTANYNYELIAVYERIIKYPELTYEDIGGAYAVSGIVDFSGKSITVVVPETYKGLPVTEISEILDRGSYEDVVLVIPDSIELIASAAITTYDYRKDGIVILCEATSKPAFWADDWIDASVDCTIIWGVEISDGWVYKKNGNEYSVEAYIGSDEDVTVPSTYNGLSVTKMSSAFCGHSWMESVTIPNSIKTISDHAFSGCILESLSIPASVTEISAKAFYGASVDNITVASGNTDYKIDEGCLIEISTSTVLFGTSESTVPSYVKHIGNGAFENRVGISEITLPSGLLSIGDYAFSKSDINNIVIPGSVTSIGEYAFYECTSLESVTISAGVSKTIGKCCFEWCSALEKVIMNSGVISIGDQAFSDCTSLTEAVLSDTLVSIGNSGFSGCSKLPSIIIPHSVTTMGMCVFYGCSRIKIYCEAPSQPKGWETEEETWNESGRPVVWGYGATPTYSLVGDEYTVTGSSGNGYSIVIPETYNGKKVTSIADNAFAGNTAIEEVSLPSGLKSIGAGAFAGCTGLNTHVLIPDGVTTIGNGAFKNCSNLTGIVIPDTVTSMGADVFNGCTILDITCISTEQPSTWNANWNSSNCDVGWGYTPGLIISTEVDSGGIEIARKYQGTSTVVVIPGSVRTICDGFGRAEVVIVMNGVVNLQIDCFDYVNIVYVPLSVTSTWSSFGENTVVYYEGSEKNTGWLEADWERVNHSQVTMPY